MDTLVMDAAYAYQGHFVEKGHRLTTWHRFKAVDPVSLIRLSPGEAPVALRLSRVLPPNPKEGRPERLQDLEYRWDGDRMMRPLLSTDGEPMTVDAFRDAMAGRAMVAGPHQDKAWPDNPLLVFEQDSYSRKLRQVDVFCKDLREEIEIRRWESDDRQARLADLHERARQVVVVGDVVHRLAPEPTWELRCAGEDSRLGVCLTEPEPSIDKVRFRADRVNEALSVASMLGVNVRPAGRVQVVVEDALRFDSLGDSALRVFGKLSRHVGDLLPDLASGEAARAWADLKDASMAWRAGDAGALARGFEALRRVADADWTPEPGPKEGKDLFPRQVLPFLVAYERFEAPRMDDADVLMGLGAEAPRP